MERAPQWLERRRVSLQARPLQVALIDNSDLGRTQHQLVSIKCRIEYVPYVKVGAKTGNPSPVTLSGML